MKFHGDHSAFARPRLQSVKTAVKGSPVLLVGTHAESEECTEEFLGRLKTELLQKFRFKYPNMAGVHFVSAVSGKNIDQLLGGIRDIIAKQVRPRTV
jgi:predicted GTPase